MATSSGVVDILKLHVHSEIIQDSLLNAKLKVIEALSASNLSDSSEEDFSQTIKRRRTEIPLVDLDNELNDFTSVIDTSNEKCLQRSPPPVRAAVFTLAPGKTVLNANDSPENLPTTTNTVALSDITQELTATEGVIASGTEPTTISRNHSLSEMNISMELSPESPATPNFAHESPRSSLIHDPLESGCQSSSLPNSQSTGTEAMDKREKFHIEKLDHCIAQLQTELIDERKHRTEDGKKLDLILQLLQEQSPKSIQPNIKCVDKELKAVLPLKTVQIVEEFDKNLSEDTDAATKLCHHLSSAASNNANHMVLVIMKSLLNRNVALEYTLEGLRGKKNFSGLQLYNVVIAAVKMCYPEVSSDTVRKRISQVLASARDWDGNRYNRRNKTDHNQIHVNSTV